MTTIQSELVTEKETTLPVPLPPNASITREPAFPNAQAVIAEAHARAMERHLMAHGYREMATEMLEWSETTLVAQAETLPKE